MKYNENEILAGIVTYNPDIIRLRENISALLKQIKYVYIVDNGSENIKEIIDLITDNQNNIIGFKRFENNCGIAAALKEIMNFASFNKYKWVLSLDQDSIVEPGLIIEYIKAANMDENSNVGMFTCLIKDRNFIDKKYEEQATEYVNVPYCITSAAFTNVQKYNETLGYDESFFIDAVDFDICYSLREKGFLIKRINYVGLFHEVGHGENRFFLGKQIVVYHQNPFRIYFYARNIRKMHKKHKELYPAVLMVKTELALFLKILLYEDLKLKKMKAFFYGIINRKYI